MPESTPIPEPESYADALVSGMRQIRDHLTEWTRSDKHETADIPLAGGWVVGLIADELARFDNEPGLRERMDFLGPVIAPMIRDAREASNGDVRREH